MRRIQDIKINRISSRRIIKQPELKQESKYTTPPKERDLKGKPKHGLWIVALISFIFLFFALSYFFAKVTVTVNPKIENITMNENLSAIKDASGEDPSFDLIVLSGEESNTMPSTGQEEVSKKAGGTVIIYNNFGSGTQRLDINTRLEGSNGKIYKTEKQIVVPGKQGTTPGSIAVKVFGAEAGEEYNSGPLDFTIVGFKGTAKYSKFYGRSDGEITGGYKGMSPIISEEDRSNALDGLKKTLQEKLFKKIAEQIPDGFVLFKDSTFLKIEGESEATEPDNDNLVLTVKGALYVFLFDEEKLTNKIIANHITPNEGDDIFIPNIQNLNFTIFNSGDVSFDKVQKIDFNLSGNVKAVWRLDEDKFISELLGKSRKTFNQILLRYPGIESANMVISPFWKMTFPDKTKDIKVIVNYPDGK